MMRTALPAVAAGLALACGQILAQEAAPEAAEEAAQDDPHVWLEEISSPAALEWVRAENARSLAVLEADPRFEPMRREALTILTSDARIPFGEIHDGAVYNFWQDEAHVRGIWRRAGIESYRSGDPEWETLIDYDALAEQEGENWVAGARVCLEPEYRLCMVEVSDGGKDASVWREFDVSRKAFVDGGFHLPEAKTDVAWIDADTLLVGTDSGPGSLTDSGYARTLVRLERGETLRRAPRVFEGAPSDVGVFPRVERDGGTAHVFVQRATSFFETEYYHSSGAGESTRLPVPLNSDLYGVLDGRALFLLREPWRHRDSTYAEGDLVAYDLASGAVETAFAAADNQAFQDVGIAESGIVVQYLEDVSGRAARVERGERGRWDAQPIALPDNGVVKIVSAGGGTDDVMLSFESLTTPNALYYDAAGNGEPRKSAPRKIAEAPAFYDASDVVVEQRFARSKDGTEIPYFLAGRKDVLERGNAPTVQYGYGGFLNAVLPVYYEDPGRPQHGALAGRLWLSRGGVLVLANIRGGSEYGPAWHAAALEENRQKAIDDFIAVSEALIESGVTSPDRLGAVGRSNGGLLMGAILTQRPELYAAIDIGVPLFDMKRYTQLGAGASWIGEYGDPEDPEDWAYISRYSPYQNLRPDEPYPQVFLYTSTQDDRVHPGHARKAAARLDALGYDYFYYENTEGGHGGTSNQEQLAYRTALEYAYFAHMLMPLSDTAAGNP
ncbi:MAG: S9 family peptidase [Gammaproteobacteria bacterium]|nr:S9 family peptidase [Gammaproteobacteria bacterium]